MFARIVTMPLKPNTAAEFKKAMENGVIPLLRRYKGFRDEIALVTSDGKFGLGISFWDTKENAESYDLSGYTEIMKALDRLLAGSTQLQICEVTNSTIENLHVRQP